MSEQSERNKKDEPKPIKPIPSPLKVITSGLIFIITVVVAFQLISVGCRWMDLAGLKILPDLASGKVRYVDSFIGNTIIMIFLVLILLYLADHFKEKLTGLL